MILNRSSVDRGLAHGSIYKTEALDLRNHKCACHVPVRNLLVGGCDTHLLVPWLVYAATSPPVPPQQLTLASEHGSENVIHHLHQSMNCCCGHVPASTSPVKMTGAWGECLSQAALQSSHAVAAQEELQDTCTACATCLIWAAATYLVAGNSSLARWHTCSTTTPLSNGNRDCCSLLRVQGLQSCVPATAAEPCHAQQGRGSVCPAAPSGRLWR